MKTTVEFKAKEGDHDEDIELLSHLNKKKLSIIEEKFPKDGNQIISIFKILINSRSANERIFGCHA